MNGQAPIAILENVSLAVHDSPASLRTRMPPLQEGLNNLEHALPLLSFCYYTSNAAIHELRGNCELFGTLRCSFFNGQCMN